MTATDELRRLLDERGVEHHDYDHSDERVTEWANGGRRNARYEEWNSGTVRLDASNITPEQAIAATLGDADSKRERHGDAGTCELINAADDLGKGTSSCMCFECGYTAIDDWWDEFKYCPNCGRRIEVDEC